MQVLAKNSVSIRLLTFTELLIGLNQAQVALNAFKENSIAVWLYSRSLDDVTAGVDFLISTL